MINKLEHLLDILDGTLNPVHQQIIKTRYLETLNWEPVERLPLICTFPYPEAVSFQPFPHRETIDNPEKMLYNELVYAFNTSVFLHSEIKDDLPFTIRANFGTVIIASLFGGKVEQRDDNPPWIRHFETMNDYKTIFETDPSDFTRGICPMVIDRYKFYNHVLQDFPNLKKCIRIVLPDLQGPLDTLELLRGSKIYEDFILEQEMTEKGLGLMAKAQVEFAKYLQQFISDDVDGYSHQHATAIKGNILIRNDSAIMISPEMYASQVAPHDEFVLREMGGGGIHSCGKIDFNIPEIFNLPSLQCFDFGQSQYNNLPMIYSLAEEKKIPLIRIKVQKNELLSGEILKPYPTGATLIYDAVSLTDAKETIKAYSN